MFTDIKIGDEVILKSRYDEEIVKVTKVTPKRFEANGLMWRKEDGGPVGGDIWSTNHIMPLTEEACKRINLKRLLNTTIAKFKKVQNNMSYDDLKAVLDILSKY